MDTIKTKLIKNYFKRKPEVAAVYLYGSYARGEAKETSDIDLAVLLIKEQNSLSFFAFSPELSKITGKKVEVQDLKSCRVDFTHRVLSEGKLLVSSNKKAQITFEEQVFRKYFDLKPFLDEYYESLSKIAKRGELHVRYLQN